MPKILEKINKILELKEETEKISKQDYFADNILSEEEKKKLVEGGILDEHKDEV